MTELSERVKEAGLRSGLADVRIASAGPFAATRVHIEDRKALGFFGRMRFTMARPDESCDPGAALPDARSLVVGAFGYWRPEPTAPPGVRFLGRIARFSWTDWYAGLRSGLGAAAAVLEAEGFRARVMVDANGLVDRAAAERAGIGWFGKNTNVLHPRLGSWVLLGSLVTDAELRPDPTSRGTCGTCERCLPACPTGAFVAPGVLDARLCISYMLQAPGDIPREMREAVATRFYGCDDCQDPCPPNHRAVRKGDVGAAPPGAIEAHVDLGWVLAASDDELLARFGRFYIPKREARYLRRNALVALGNLGDRGAVDLVSRFLLHDDPMLRRHAAWALGRLGGKRAGNALSDAVEAEPDPSVRVEIEHALTSSTA